MTPMMTLSLGAALLRLEAVSAAAALSDSCTNALRSMVVMIVTPNRYFKSAARTISGQAYCRQRRSLAVNFFHVQVFGYGAQVKWFQTQHTR
jgi:hypothetical protein